MPRRVFAENEWGKAEVSSGTAEVSSGTAEGDPVLGTPGLQGEEQRLCKVEFIQPSIWLYSVPNLLVIQHLVTLYLGGFDVRVVSEIE